MRVLVVSTWNTSCGIAEYAAYLKESVERADPSIEMVIESNLHPSVIVGTPRGAQVICLNYQAALLSQWHPEHIRACQAEGLTVVVIWHDSGVPNSDQCKALHAVADAFVVHEPAEDLPGAIYWRQGIPDWGGPYYIDKIGTAQRPWLGSVGFPFPWKNFDLLAEATGIAGWGLLLLAPKATQDQFDRWRAANPYLRVLPEFEPRNRVVALLSGCDATAFPYNAANTGTSGAIRQGIAARKPVIASAFPAGRQFRDLQLDPLARRVITWIEPSLDGLVEALSEVRIAPIDAGMVALAAQDSWEQLGRKYADLYQLIAGGPRAATL